LLILQRELTLTIQEITIVLKVVSETSWFAVVDDLKPKLMKFNACRLPFVFSPDDPSSR
jgi:hypothetical protein